MRWLTTASIFSPSMLTAWSRNAGTGPAGAFVAMGTAGCGQANGSREDAAGEVAAHERSSSRIAKTGGVSNFSSVAPGSGIGAAAAATRSREGNFSTFAATPNAARTARQLTTVLFRSGFVMLVEGPEVQLNLRAAKPFAL